MTRGRCYLCPIHHDHLFPPRRTLTRKDKVKEKTKTRKSAKIKTPSILAQPKMAPVVFLYKKRTKFKSTQNKVAALLDYVPEA